MLLYWPKRYIDNWFPKRYFQIRKDKVIIKPPKKDEISLGGYSPLHHIDKEDLFDVIKLKTPGSKLQTLINKVLVKLKSNEDEEIILSLINLTYEKRTEDETIKLVVLVAQLIEIIEQEEQTKKDEKNMELIIEEINKLNLI